MLQSTELRNQAGAAIEQLYHAHHSALLAYLRRLVGDSSAAEDLCHETFLKALRSWDQCGQIANGRAWLYRIATNTAYDHLRRRRRIQFAPLDDTAESPSYVSLMESRMYEQEPVQQVLSQLSPQSRLLLLCISAGHSAQEIAVVLDCSDTAVRLRLFRARARFRKVYSSLCGDC